MIFATFTNTSKLGPCVAHVLYFSSVRADHTASLQVTIWKYKQPMRNSGKPNRVVLIDSEPLNHSDLGGSVVSSMINLEAGLK